MATSYSQRQDLLARNIAGETLVVPIRGRLADMQNIYALNPVAAHIWTKLDKTCSLDDLVQSVRTEFDVADEEARADIEAFLSELSNAGLIEIVKDGQ